MWHPLKKKLKSLKRLMNTVDTLKMLCDILESHVIQFVYHCCKGNLINSIHRKFHFASSKNAVNSFKTNSYLEILHKTSRCHSDNYSNASCVRKQLLAANFLSPQAAKTRINWKALSANKVLIFTKILFIYTNNERCKLKINI